eukprot:9397995-Pyramimonas_sp.AAC.1
MLSESKYVVFGRLLAGGGQIVSAPTGARPGVECKCSHWKATTEETMVWPKEGRASYATAG